MSEQRPRGIVEQFLATGWLQTLGLDAIAALGILLIGVTVWHLAPELVWGYLGVVCIVVSLIVGRMRAKAASTAPGGEA